MRTIQSLLLAALACWLGGNALAQSYSINGFKIAGGGGASANGPYSLSGTIGQHDAGGPMTNGPYSLECGFWTLYAVQMPGAPTLTVTRTNNTVVVSWPLPASGYVLEWTNALPQVAAPWPQIPPPYQTNGGNLQFIEPSPTGNKFYRLHKP